MKLKISNTRALTLADVVDLPAPQASRPKKNGIPCGCCGVEVYHSRPSRATVPVCDDCRREADLCGFYICRDADHVGERVIVHHSFARQHSDPLLDICLQCWQLRHPGRRTRVLEENPHQDPDQSAGSLAGFAHGTRLVSDWLRFG